MASLDEVNEVQFQDHIATYVTLTIVPIMKKLLSVHVFIKIILQLPAYLYDIMLV
jgi:hypothetical protein